MQRVCESLWDNIINTSNKLNMSTLEEQKLETEAKTLLVKLVTAMLIDKPKEPVQAYIFNPI